MKKKIFILFLLVFSLNLYSATQTNSDLTQDDNFDSDTFFFFHSYKCPHCKEAKPFVNTLEKFYKDKGIKVRDFEVLKNTKNRDLFQKKVNELKITGVGVPLFIIGDSYEVGYKKGDEDRLIKMIDKHYGVARNENGVVREGHDLHCDPDENSCIKVPLFGCIDPQGSLPMVTLFIGLLDGVNPCAMWVLMFLLTLLVNTKSRKRLIMVGSVFVISSGVVYFLFMTAWLNMFTFMGLSQTITIILGIIALLMGIINFKEFFFFKKGVSLMIPEKAKPTLFKKMRGIMNNKSTFLSIVGTIALSFFVNLIELGCTVGLPAIYTRILSIQKVGTATKYFYMMLYNVYYVIPLAVIVLFFVLTMGKHRFQEKHAKGLKLVSGLLMVVMGLILIFSPSMLSLS